MLSKFPARGIPLAVKNPRTNISHLWKRKIIDSKVPWNGICQFPRGYHFFTQVIMIYKHILPCFGGLPEAGKAVIMYNQPKTSYNPTWMMRILKPHAGTQHNFHSRQFDALKSRYKTQLPPQKKKGSQNDVCCVSAGWTKVSISSALP